jgi:hypothetical protein
VGLTDDVEAPGDDPVDGTETTVLCRSLRIDDYLVSVLGF